MSPLDLGRDFLARLRLVSPRLVGRGQARVFNRDTLPDEVREALEATGPAVPAYLGLAPFWHEHWSAIVPRYGVYAQALLRSGRLKGDGALDLACGTGIAAADLAPLFRRVFALDASPHLLAQARTRLAPNPHATCLEGSFLDFSLPEPVELVVCAGNSLNYALSQPALEQVFACVARALAPGGRFLFDVEAEASFEANSGLTFRYRLGGAEWWQDWRYDPATRIDDALALTPMGVERHRRRFFSEADVLAAAARAGLRPTGRFRHPLLRQVARGTGWDFYELAAPPAPYRATSRTTPVVMAGR